MEENLLRLVDARNNGRLMIKVSAHPGNGEKSDDPLSQASVNYDHSNRILFSFRVIILREQLLIGLWDV